MNAQTIREFTTEVLEALHDLVADPEPMKQTIEALFERPESTHGEKT